MSEKTCPICGKPTRLYYGSPCKDGLCATHGKLVKEKKIEFCAKCTTWHTTNEPCKCNSYSKTNIIQDKDTKVPEHDCPICGNKTQNKYICNECYQKVDNHTEAIDKNTTAFMLREYYYNLKGYIYRSDPSRQTTLYNQLTKLFTIADLQKRLFNRNDLFNRVFDDILEIKENKKEKEVKEKETAPKLTEADKIKKDINIAGVNRAKDGHFVKSEYEITIDDILFDLFQIHVYEKIVPQITERTVVCDWYIPVYQNFGIYIELWGIDKDYEYTLNKEEKKALYKKHELPLIEIEKDELSGDTQGLSCRIQREIIKYKEEIKRHI